MKVPEMKFIAVRGMGNPNEEGVTGADCGRKEDICQMQDVSLRKGKTNRTNPGKNCREKYSPG